MRVGELKTENRRTETGIPRLAASLKEQIRELAAIARAHAADPDPATAIRAGMLALWRSLARRHGCLLSDSELAQVFEGDLLCSAPPGFRLLTLHQSDAPVAVTTSILLVLPAPQGLTAPFHRDTRYSVAIVQTERASRAPL